MFPLESRNRLLFFFIKKEWVDKKRALKKRAFCLKNPVRKLHCKTLEYEFTDSFLLLKHIRDMLTPGPEFVLFA
ncbi:protein of unknown function [Candidatus Methylacidiphilum fumarolicum]|uniref:Uncharacterized protein n=1 Tax=Candidatus Methylacidiphilum fumarolicum TaxID=591154 RepID=A0ABN8XDQ1_9BACT|nr:protein of unknown function [Candidatus Methylacidiphilum fumarolicum]